MALVTRTISNAGSPLTDVNGGLLANTVIRFTLVNDRSYAAGTFDVETGEPVAPGPYVAITDEAGLFSVALWPTSRGLEQRFYLCEIAPASDTIDFPAFKAPLADGIGTLPFLAFRLAGDAVAEWETTAFTAHVENSAIHGGGGSSANIYYQPEPPASPTDGTAWIDSDETGGQFPITVNADWNATSGLAEILNKPTLGSAAAADADDFAPATHDHDADYEPSGAVAGHESTYNHSLLHAPGSDDQDLSGYSLNTHGHDADYEAAGEVAAHELAFDHTQLHTHGQALETTDSPEFADVTITGLTGAVIGTAPTVGEALTAIDHMLTITGDAVTSHTGLAGRSLPDQHPISAISGLQEAISTPVAPTIYSATLAANGTTFSLNGLSIADGEEYSFYLHTQIVTLPAKTYGVAVSFNSGNKFSGCCSIIGPAIPGIIEAIGGLHGFIYSQYTDDGLTLDLFFVGTLVLYQGNITLFGHAVNKGNGVLAIFSGNGTTTETSVTSITISSTSSTIQADATFRLIKRY